MSEFWLFQATPDQYRLIDQIPSRLRAGDFWDATRFHDKMKPKDGVIFWQSGKEAGIYGFGRIKSDPYRERGEWRVDVKYEPLLPQPLFKKDLVKHSLLRNLGVIKIPRNTIYPITSELWHAVQELVVRDSLNIFRQYDGEENQFTNGLCALLDLSRHDGPSFATNFQRELLGLDLKGRVMTSRVLRSIDGTADAEWCGPDWCIRLECKIASGTLREVQVENHLDRLMRAPEARKILVLLTPDDAKSMYVTDFLNHRCVRGFCGVGRRNKVLHLEWAKVYDFLKRYVDKHASGIFSDLVAQFVKRIHDRISAQDFAGIIQKIAFGNESEVYAQSNDRHKGYLEEIEDWNAWNTPRKYEKLDGKGRKLILYDSVRKALTAEVEIAEVAQGKQRGKYDWINSFVPNTLKVYRMQIPLSRIVQVPGFHNFTRGMAAAWNVTREQYKLLMKEDGT